MRYAIVYAQVKITKYLFAWGRAITPKGIYKQKLQFLYVQFLRGVTLKTFMPCVNFVPSIGFCLTILGLLIDDQQ